jgi:hypothetical protein
VEFDHSFEVIYPWTTGVDSITLGGTAGVNIPAGATASRSSAPVAGSTRINTDTSQLEYYTGSAWLSHGAIAAGTGIAINTVSGVSTISSSGGSVTSVGLSLPSIFTVSGTPVTSTGTLTASLTSQGVNTVLAAPSGAAGTPTFRTIGLATGDLNDVTITGAAAGQVLSYNGSKWINAAAAGGSGAGSASGLVGFGQTGVYAWTLLSGTTYYADFPHNLGTYSVVVTIFDSSTNIVVQADMVTLTSNNNVRVQVTGNSRTLRVVVVSFGSTITGVATPSAVITQMGGVQVSAAATTLNFTGQAVKVSDAGSGTTNISIGARYTYFANSLDSVNSADFAVNGLSPVTTDPLSPAFNVRSFLNTAETGVGLMCSIPQGATQLTLRLKGRPATAPVASSVVMFKLYNRLISSGASMGAWSGTNLANNVIPTNAFFQYFNQTLSLATLGLTAGNLYQFEITRPTTGFTGTNLPYAFLLAEITLEFS